MRPVIHHADDGKEESRHDAVREHLQPGSGQPFRGQGRKSNENQSHVRDG